MITADDVNTLKQIVVDAYDFLNGNGFDVSTVDANAAQLYRTELAGETTVDKFHKRSTSTYQIISKSEELPQFEEALFF